MGRVKETLEGELALEQDDILAMQAENARASVTHLEEYLDHLLWRVQFYGDRLTPEHLQHIRDEIRHIALTIL